MVVQKHIFWEALLIAIFIFASGILVGYFIELNRTSKIITAYQQAELNLLDIQIQQNTLGLSEFDCSQAVKQTIDFADRTYGEAQLLEKYSDSARLSSGIVFQHKKYDLLRAILWANAMKIKESCPESFHTVVYFYEYDPRYVQERNQETEAKQRTFSKYLAELKEKHGNDIILIPIAGNMDINAVSLLMSTYGITGLPATLVDEEFKVTEIENLDEIEARIL